MRITTQIFCFLLFFNLFVTQLCYDEFTFNAMSLGHSGLLITWEPHTSGEETNNEYLFLFEIFIIDGRNDNVTYKRKNSPNKNESFCRSSAGQYKIHSLNESTLYEVIVRQYNTRSQYTNTYDFSGIKDQLNEYPYTIKIKTNKKFTYRRLPAKPYFEFVLENEFSSKGVIRWYPCGRERICHGEESGTHFGIKIKELSDARKMNEIDIEEFYFDYKEIHFWPGKIYDVIVYSVYGEYKTESDYLEIFIQPWSTPVQYVNVISLPDSSVLISWKPPKHLPDQYLANNLFHWVIYFSELDADKNYILLGDFLDAYKNSSFEKNRMSILRERISNLKPKLVYTFVIIPYDVINDPGLEYRMKHKHQVYNHDLPIAKPDFDYENTYAPEPNCGLYIHWLPCGKSFACKDTKPGTNFTLEFKPDTEFKTRYYNKYGSADQSGFLKDVVYHVTMKSSIGSNFSEPVTKILKNCKEIRKNIP